MRTSTSRSASSSRSRASATPLRRAPRIPGRPSRPRACRPDRGRACPAAGVEPEEQLDHVVVGGIDRRLDDVDVAAADVLEQPYEDRALGEAHGLRVRRPYTELLA